MDLAVSQVASPCHELVEDFEVASNLRKEQMENWPVEKKKKKHNRVKTDWKARLKGEGIEH